MNKQIETQGMISFEPNDLILISVEDFLTNYLTSNISPTSIRLYRNKQEVFSKGLILYKL